MTKLEILSISYMPSLMYIGKGTLSGLQSNFFLKLIQI